MVKTGDATYNGRQPFVEVSLKVTVNGCYWHTVNLDGKADFPTQYRKLHHAALSAAT